MTPRSIERITGLKTARLGPDVGDPGMIILFGYNDVGEVVATGYGSNEKEALTSLREDN